MGMLVTGIPMPGVMRTVQAEVLTDDARSSVAVQTQKTENGYRLTNGFFDVEVGTYGQITSLKIIGDLYPTNYVMNMENAPEQNTAAHQWMGELMFQTRLAGSDTWTEAMTSKSDSARTIELQDNKLVITYENATEEKGIKDFKLIETYYLDGEQLKWDITVENSNEESLEIGDWGLPLAFNEYWSRGDEIYETRVVDHSFIGKDSSYIYATRPSGLGQYLLFTPQVETGAGFEYQDHWRVEERNSEEKAWCQDQNGWASGLNVYYIHSKVIQKTNRGYLENTSLTLAPGESKTYGFAFSIADDEADMKSTLYEEGIIDAVAVPGMTFAKNMPAKMYLHTSYDIDDIDVSIKCPHELGLHDGNPNTVCNMLTCKKNEDNTKAEYIETKIIDGEQYHIYELSFEDLGQNDVYVSYAGEKKETEYQFYIMDDVETALNTHSTFMVENTQWDAEGELYDKVFDDWMMDTKSKRGEFYGYWGWGDDWGLTHGEYIAEKNVFIPVASEIEAVDEYLDVAIWNGLMQEHQADYLIHDFLMEEPNTTPTYRGYAYPHIYNTYYSMYKIASKYPDMVTYIEDTDTYLLRAYNILKALYTDGVAYNWATGVMGELTTPDIIQSLKKEGYYTEAEEVQSIMEKKYDNFKNTKYPYGSEYSYDNTGEEAVYTLAKLNLANDTANANTMMAKIDAKTRACRGLQPVWYHYANPTTICGESWWNFQYTAALAGYCMDDYLRLEDNQYSVTERALAERVNYAAKLANLTCINSGQIDADPENIGTVSWTYQSEMGNLGGQGTGGGKLHNGWRQMAGEADLGLFGALQILSADVATDPIFGLFGYGCEVTQTGDDYQVTPLDGLSTRLNFLDEQLYIELDRDKYTQASVKTDCTGIILEVENLEGTTHNTDMNITGLVDGAYRIMVNGTEVGTFKAEKQKTSTITVALPKANTAKVEICAGAEVRNTAPIVNAGADKEVYLPSCAGMEAVTIAMDVKLTASQSNNTRLFEFGDMDGNMLYVSFKNGNKLYLSATDMNTGKLNTVDTGMQIAPEYWKNIAITSDENQIVLYVDGIQVAAIENSGFDFAKLGNVQRNFIGRSAEDSIAFLQGAVDGFEIYSYAMTEEEIAENYGTEKELTIVSVKDVTLIVPVGTAAEFPKTVNGLFTDGLYRDVVVTWDEVDAALYEAAGSFDVYGTLEVGRSENETDEAEQVKAVAHVLVVEGTVQNLAPYAVGTAIIDTPSDLGGVAGLNDGYEPTSSRDTSHGVWHNWHGNQSDEAWVQYVWEEEVVITAQDAYYFTDGNFAPADVALFYLDDAGDWLEMTGEEGLGVELNQYNYTSFDAVSTKGIRMVMNPKTLGVGVIEWKVYGYSDKKMLDTNAIKDAIEWAGSIQESKITDGWSALQEKLQVAQQALETEKENQENLDNAAKELYQAIADLTPVDGNLAYIARVETSFVSAWESLDAVNDGLLPSASNVKDVSAYGSWGNTSAFETITYKWPSDITIKSTGIYFWTDGGGIHWPVSYQYEYLIGSDWVAIEDSEGYGLEENLLNMTTVSDTITTTAIRVKINKVEANGEGVGVFEWTVSSDEADNSVEKPKEEQPEELVIPEGSVNLAPKATPSGSDDKTYDGGGLAELQDEDDALLDLSSSTENGFWHNWEGFGKDAWVQYTWEEAVTLTGMDIYYFATWEGFKTKQLTLSYLQENGEWADITDAQGMGTDLDTWNTTVFQTPIITTALKMVLTPVSNSVGILEWRVYGYELEEESLMAVEETASAETEVEEENDIVETETAEEETTGVVETETVEVEATEVVETETVEVETTEEEPTDVEKTEITEVKESEAEVTEAAVEECAQEEVLSEQSELETMESDLTLSKVTVLVNQVFRGTNQVAEVEDVSTTGMAKTRLYASVIDDGYPNMTFSYHWEVSKAPEGASVQIAYPEKPISDVRMDLVGEYQFTLMVSDGELSSSDTITIQVKEDAKIPELLAKYDFSQETIDTEKREISDMKGSGYQASYSYNPLPKFEKVDEKDVLRMTGGFCGYVKLSEELTQGKVTAEVIKTSNQGNNENNSQSSGGKVDEDNSQNDNHYSGEASSSNPNVNKQNAAKVKTEVVTKQEEVQVIPQAEVALAPVVTDNVAKSQAAKTPKQVIKVLEAELPSVAETIKQQEEKLTEEIATEEVETEQAEVIQTEQAQIAETEEKQIEEEAVPLALIEQDATSYWFWLVGLGVVVIMMGSIWVFLKKQKSNTED